MRLKHAKIKTPNVTADGGPIVITAKILMPMFTLAKLAATLKPTSFLTYQVEDLGGRGRT